MNPLITPWGQKRKLEDLDPSKNFIGIRNEVVRSDAKAEVSISVEVRGVKGVPNGNYSLAYTEGTTLGRYLARLKLKRTGIYSAVYDQKNLEKGRLRMNYIPQPDACILIGSIAYGPLSHLARTNVDAQKLAFNMGRTGHNSPPKEVVMDMTYKENR